MKNKMKIKRAEQNLTQEELSVKTGISRTSLVNIEKGYQIPNILTAKKISNALDSSIEEVFLADV